MECGNTLLRHRLTQLSVICVNEYFVTENETSCNTGPGRSRSPARAQQFCCNVAGRWPSDQRVRVTRVGVTPGGMRRPGP